MLFGLTGANITLKLKKSKFSTGFFLEAPLTILKNLIFRLMMAFF